MRRPIATITATISTVLGIVCSGRIAILLAGLRLRVLYLARTLLAWHSDRMLVRVHAVDMRRVPRRGASRERF